MLDFDKDYENWRRTRLEAWSDLAARQFVTIADPVALTATELEQLRCRCERLNFALYRLENPEIGNKEAIRALVKQLGMMRLDKNLCADNDSITTLKIMNLGRASGYIPYTDQALNWHTDGYYNPQPRHIRSFLLHCVRSATRGGENMLLNHELLYIRLRDRDPALVSALMQDDVLTIPANKENGDEVRSRQTGPVFYRDEQTGALQMRYTARARNIEWKNEPGVRQAIAVVEQLLQNDLGLAIRITLQSGEGLICNNILHGRSAFTNGNIPGCGRMLYRARSYDRLFWKEQDCRSC